MENQNFPLTLQEVIEKWQARAKTTQKQLDAKNRERDLTEKARPASSDGKTEAELPEYES